MSEERKTLTASLMDTFFMFKERKTVGRMTTEHEIFIPAELMRNAEDETAEFIKVARHINNQQEWNCPVTATPKVVMKTPGTEFLFTFQPNTQFDDIIAYISTKI